MRKPIQCLGAFVLLVFGGGCRDGLGPVLKDIRTNAEEYTDLLMQVQDNETAKQLIDDKGPLKKLKEKAQKIGKRFNRFLKYYDRDVKGDSMQDVAEEYADMFEPYFRDMHANSKRLKVQAIRLTKLYNERPEGEEWFEMRSLIDATRSFFSSTDMRPISQISQQVMSNKKLKVVSMGMALASRRVMEDIQQQEFQALFGDPGGNVDGAGNINVIFGADGQPINGGEGNPAMPGGGDPAMPGGEPPP